MAGSSLNLFSINPDGSNQTQLTANVENNYTPATTPDGRFILFASYRGGSLNIWRINAEDGSDPKQLTFSDGNSYPSCSPDGEWVFYDNQSNRTFTVWKVPIGGGNPVQVTDKYTRMPVVSPDGQFIACRYLVEGGSREIAIFRSDGGAPIERLPIPVMEWQQIQWMPDGRVLTYVDSTDGVSNIWGYDLAGRSKKQLTYFKTDDQIFAYSWSPDFKQLACLRGSELRDVIIINSQP
jgi:TolB protein